jgi:F-type H+-transporting ATPase subunit delta
VLYRRIAKRYARSLFLVAKKTNEVDVLGKELSALGQLVEETKGLSDFLSSPTVTSEAKGKVLGTAAEKIQATDYTKRFLEILLRYERAQYLPAISQSYKELTDSEARILRGTVTSAEKLSSKQLNDIGSALKESTGFNVELSPNIDPSLIAGFRVHIEDVTLDATVRGSPPATNYRLKPQPDQ